MLNPDYFFSRLRDVLEEFEPGRERSLAATKIDEAELWLTRCTVKAEAMERDQVAPPAGSGEIIGR
jgi:hypothetical protein